MVILKLSRLTGKVLASYTAFSFYPRISVPSLPFSSAPYCSSCPFPWHRCSCSFQTHISHGSTNIYKLSKRQFSTSKQNGIKKLPFIPFLITCQYRLIVCNLLICPLCCHYQQPEVTLHCSVFLSAVNSCLNSITC